MKTLPKTYKKLEVCTFTDNCTGYTVISLTNTKCTDSAAFYIIDGDIEAFGSTPVLHKWRNHVKHLAKQAELI